MKKTVTFLAAVTMSLCVMAPVADGQPWNRSGSDVPHSSAWWKNHREKRNGNNKNKTTTPVPSPTTTVTPEPSPVEVELNCTAHGLSDSEIAGLPVADLSSDGVSLSQTHRSPQGTTSNYHLFDHGVDYSEPVGVMVKLHGDGAEEYDSASRDDAYVRCLAAQVAEDNMILVVPKSPDRKGEITWWENMVSNREWVLDLLDTKVMNRENVDTSRVHWYGYSGGAEFISYALLPVTPEYVTGGAILLSGGGAPSRTYAVSDLKSYLPLHWVVGELDDGSTSWDGFNALSAATKGERHYRENLGYRNTHLTILKDTHHYNVLPSAVYRDISSSWQ